MTDERKAADEDRDSIELEKSSLADLEAPDEPAEDAKGGAAVSMHRTCGEFTC